MAKTKIEWTDATWNPVRGCTKISQGCKHCYASVFAERWRGIPGHPYEQGFDLRLVPEKLLEPLQWGQSRVVFVNSMSDLFQEQVPDGYIKKVFEVMLAANWHIFQVLTKRHERMHDFVNTYYPDLGKHTHIWLGVSVENRKQGLPRVAHLQRTPAFVRFLSVEPLLEHLGPFDLTGLDWVIVGGESGAGARPMSTEWVQAIKHLCQQHDVAFFFKQWGGVHKKKAGRLLDGRTYDEMPSLDSTLPPSLLTRRKEHARMLAMSNGVAV